MDKNFKAGIVCCSDGQPRANEKDIIRLENTLKNIGITPIFSPYIYEDYNVFSACAEKRADALMDFYNDDEIKAIFDISGGDIANEVLGFLDFEKIAKSNKRFWGYSDLSTVINAIYSKTGKSSVLYQIRNLVYDHGEEQTRRFKSAVFENGRELFDIKYRFIQGENMEGIVVGGNIRCLLKLAGTEYFPDTRDKILLLEAWHGRPAQMTAYLNQLKYMGVFENVRGILLGTFMVMEAENSNPDIIELVKKCAGESVPIAKTREIGHATDSKAIVIGEYMRFEGEKA